MFAGRTDAEAEAPISWPSDAKIWLVEKDPDAGKNWRQGEKGMAEDEMVGWHHWLNVHEFGQAPGDGEEQEAWHAQFIGLQRAGHDWATEQQEII